MQSNEWPIPWHDYDVEISFELLYMKNHIVTAKSGILESKIKSRHSIKGKVNGFYFESTDGTKGEEFEWELSEFKVNKI